MTFHSAALAVLTELIANKEHTHVGIVIDPDTEVGATALRTARDCYRPAEKIIAPWSCIAFILTRGEALHVAVRLHRQYFECAGKVKQLNARPRKSNTQFRVWSIMRKTLYFLTPEHRSN